MASWVGTVAEWWTRVEQLQVQYTVPVMDWTGSTQLIKARGVNYTVYMEARRVPVEDAAEMTKRALKAHQTEDQLDMVIRKDDIDQSFCRWLFYVSQWLDYACT